MPSPRHITQRKDKIQTTPRCSYLSHVQLEYERIKQLRLLLQSGVDRLSSTKFFCMCRFAILDVGYFMFFIFYRTKGSTFRQVPTRRIRLSFVECAYPEICYIISEVYNGFRYRKGWHSTLEKKLGYILGFHFY